MKRILVTVFVSVGFLLISGCSDKGDSVLSPAQSPAPVAKVQHQSGMRPEPAEPMSCIQPGQIINNPVTLIPLPSPPWNRTGSSSTSLITSRYGGRVRLAYSYFSKLGKRVTVSAMLIVPPGAIDNDTYVTMSLDDNYVGLKFKPEGLKFKVPAELNFSAMGLDLSMVPFGESISLYYVNLFTSTFEEVNALSVSSSKSQGTIVCYDAQISHFSRYAFGY
jgi:hypothetical protein